MVIEQCACEHDWDGCTCKLCGQVQDSCHDMVLVEKYTTEYPTSYVGAHDGCTEDTEIYKCSKCGTQDVRLFQY